MITKEFSCQRTLFGRGKWVISWTLKNVQHSDNRVVRGGILGEGNRMRNGTEARMPMKHSENSGSGPQPGVLSFI